MTERYHLHRNEKSHWRMTRSRTRCGLTSPLAQVDEHVHGPWMPGEDCRRRAPRRAKGMPDTHISCVATYLISAVLIAGSQMTAT